MSYYLPAYENNHEVIFTPFVVNFTSKNIVFFFKNLPEIV